MAEKIWTDQEVYDLLVKIDVGYKPTKAENAMLESRLELDLRRKPITQLPESIGRLTALQTLEISYTQITQLPESIDRLTALEYLDLSDTQITKLPESIGRLTALKELSLGGEKITELPESIGNLSSLEGLDLTGSSITKLPDSLSKLNKLESLSLHHTRLTELPEWIGDLPNLKWLDLTGMVLVRIPESLGLRGLPFIDIPRLAIRFAKIVDRDPSVNLYGVTLAEQDISIFLESPSLIPSLYEKDQVTLKECKVIFLGDGGAGKSYTIKRMRNGGRKETEENPYVTTVTHGIEISDWEIKGEDKLTVHLWDFGGQDVMHSMHRCFLTEKTCYVVTVDSRRNDGDQRANYWLKNVRSFAPNSPVLLFINCWEDADGSGVIDDTGLRSEYKEMIKDVIYCSAKEASYTEFREKIMAVIEKTVRASGFGQQKVPPRYYKARREIGKLSKERPFLTKAEYHEICTKHGIENENAMDLLTFFNNIGACFSYHRDRDRKELEDYRLLQPLWLTNAVYAIIEEGKALAADGSLSIEAISRMLCNNAPNSVGGKPYRRVAPDMDYGEDQIEYILAVAEAYELCYISEQKTAFFPALLTSNSPREANEYTDEYPNKAEYRFVYENLPDSVVHRLMIRFKKNDIAINACWLKGMVLGSMGNHKAIIRIMDEKTLRVEVLSKEGKPASEFFPLIRRGILGVNDALGRSAREEIAKGKDVFTIKYLRNTYRRGQKEVSGNVTDEVYNVFELLNSFFEKAVVEGMDVDENGRAITTIYHYCEKEDKILRKALYKVYNGKCAYCGTDLLRETDMQVDHILPSKPEKKEIKGYETKMYLATLEERGFVLETPNYIENYLPCCGHCNGKAGKSNKTLELINLRLYHDRAMKNAPKIIALMEKYERTKKNK